MQVCIVRAASESQSMADFSDFFSFSPLNLGYTEQVALTVSSLLAVRFGLQGIVRAIIRESYVEKVEMEFLGAA